ncbi:unnamed protein product [Meloidogyne enterolobii]|uniref:Uncharacterized protein n=1 Tax=Meloidogyne enterolobii TaxID=390850 RepID=A0ACB0YMP4_MELEN
MFNIWKEGTQGRTHHGRGPNQSTTDCATIQPDDWLFIFIYVLSASADTTVGVSDYLEGYSGFSGIKGI